MAENPKKIKVNNKDTRTTSLMSLLLTLDIFHTFFTVSTVDFKQVNICWDNP